ncbi:MAG TPA: DUF1287 domain-containing protein [Polyangia bacterium]|nr:DUF1287 domain-containing protein [Polyangia bacterium]
MHLLIALATLASGIADRGVFSDLDAQVETLLPPAVSSSPSLWLRVDPAHRLLTLYDGADPIKVYAATADGKPARAADAEELRILPPNARVVTGAPPRAEDRDGDGIVDRLDIAIGAKKLLFLHAKYIERYVSIPYPNGDVPRTEGVCSDTVIRALRNAGIDLQKEVHEDILRAPKAYPMVEKIDASINHRRVRTLLPWFVRHFVTLPKGERFLPGDVVFFDTFPSREGPDHLGVVSDRAADKSGLPLIINNWTDGAVDAEMDLLSWVPVTHHFRAPSPPAPRK